MTTNNNNNGEFDPIILGHNQFFGVDHLNSEKGAQRAIKFSDMRNITGIIEYSMDQGVNGLMLSTHDRAKAICDALREKPKFVNELNLYPVLPYIAKYVRQANEKGLTNVVLDQIKNAPISSLFKGGAGFITKDVFKMLETLIDFELGIFKGLNVKAIFLHQALTDLALGLDMKDVFLFYHEYIRKAFNAEPAYCTYNLPFVVKKFKEYGIENPVIMAPFNSAGFLMSPSISAYEECAKNEKFRLFAMGTMASGYIHPNDAFEYVYDFPNVVSSVVGVSRQSHAKQTFGLIREQIENRKK
ncbi:MAG: hypothetical protein JKX97_02790 [Candidatus Lindowbacteria bacterium]|nr:hypothetical protein [Candidatus Lindowbacteria bacterium]